MDLSLGLSLGLGAMVFRSSRFWRVHWGKFLRHFGPALSPTVFFEALRWKLGWVGMILVIIRKTSQERRIRGRSRMIVLGVCRR